MANILIIDDDPGFCYTLCNIIQSVGHETSSEHSLEDGMKAVLTKSFDAIFLDVLLPDGSGLEALPKLRSSSSLPEVIIITGEGEANGAELAIKSGAWDYIQKPASVKDITLPLLRALEYRKEKKRIRKSENINRKGIVGNSPVFNECLDLSIMAARTDVNVFITGETGTGKECFAQMIHRNSSRASNNFVVVDCAAIPEKLVESMLFGHAKGAFTGADSSRVGLIKQADGGTLFLDEVGELPMDTQRAFLRSIQEHRFRPIGDKNEITSDFRVISATNRDADEMVKAGVFRKDLLHRLRSFSIEMPPLRKRPDDIIELAKHHMTALCNRYRYEIKDFSDDFLEMIKAYDWPGNVRELFNALESAFTKSGHDTILFPHHIPTRIRAEVAMTAIKKKIVATEDPENTPPIMSRPTLKDFRNALIIEGERKYLKDLMSFTEGDITEACKISGLGRARMYSILKKYKISKNG